MTHVVHTAHGIMRQDTEGGHHGGTQLVLSPMPKTGMQTLEIAQEELPDCYTLPGKVQTYTLFKELFLVAKKHY